jgi:N-methylhydantoinase B
MDAADVYYTHWQGGGGYGDPLRREPEKVVADLASFRVSAKAASDIYGVVITPNGAVDAVATETRRRQLRRARIDMDVV